MFEELLDTNPLRKKGKRPQKKKKEIFIAASLLQLVPFPSRKLYTEKGKTISVN